MERRQYMFSLLHVTVVYHGFDDIPGRSGIRGGTAGCELVPAGRLEHINVNINQSTSCCSVLSTLFRNRSYDKTLHNFIALHTLKFTHCAQ